MTGSDAELLLRAWEAGRSRSASVRGLLLLSAALPDDGPDALQQLSVGHRNAHLLTLRARLLGSTLDCLTRCPACAETIQLMFSVDDVRAAHAEPGGAFRVAADDYDVLFRVPTSADLIAVEHDREWSFAEHHLLARCVLEATTLQVSASVDELPTAVITAVEKRMSEIDRQAAVMLDVECPNCGVSSNPAFDVAAFVWAEIDTWARTLLTDVHTIAAAYGWPESTILAMTAARRQSYLELICA